MRSGLWVPSMPGDPPPSPHPPHMWARGGDVGVGGTVPRETDMTFTRVDQVPRGADWEYKTVDDSVERGENYSDVEKTDTKENVYI